MGKIQALPCPSLLCSAPPCPRLAARGHGGPRRPAACPAQSTNPRDVASDCLGPEPTSPPAEGGGRSNKRKRLQEESYVVVSIAQEYTKPMDLLIELLEEDMKSINVTNECLEAVNLGGHKLACTSEGKCTLVAWPAWPSMHHRPADHLTLPPLGPDGAGGDRGRLEQRWWRETRPAGPSPCSSGPPSRRSSRR